jgi:hypothetical protein
VELNWDLVLKDVKKSLNLVSVTENKGPVFLLEVKEAVNNRQDLLELLLVSRLHHVNLVLNTKVSHVWYLFKIS